MYLEIGADKDLKKFSILIADMDANQCDKMRILLKTMIDYSDVLQQADTTGIGLESLIGFVSSYNSIRGE